MGHETDDVFVSALVSMASGALGIPASEIPIDASFQNGLGVDSLGMLEIVLAVESRFQVRIPETEIGRFADGSIADAAAWIRAKRRLRESD
ncbi:acyl carrier protein [Streptomyces sp. NPDC003480]